MSAERSRRYYSIGEVAEIMGLKSHILRFWEAEFPILRPRKNRAGNRAYTERDIKIIRLIKQLLYVDKYTIEGAKKRLKTDREFVDTQLSLPLDIVKEKKRNGGTAALETELEAIRSELNDIIELVKSL